MTKRPKSTEASPASPAPAKGVAATMSAGKTAYEQRRAAEAGLSLEAWLKKKSRDAAAAVPPPAKPSARKGLFTRLLDRAHKPLKSS